MFRIAYIVLRISPGEKEGKSKIKEQNAKLHIKNQNKKATKTSAFVKASAFILIPSGLRTDKPADRLRHEEEIRRRSAVVKTMARQVSLITQRNIATN